MVRRHSCTTGGAAENKWETLRFCCSIRTATSKQGVSYIRRVQSKEWKPVRMQLHAQMTEDPVLLLRYYSIDRDVAMCKNRPIQYFIQKAATKHDTKRAPAANICM